VSEALWVALHQMAQLAELQAGLEELPAEEVQAAER
jgi:hypothetical protein